MSRYDEFLARKLVAAPAVGFEPERPINPKLFGWQAEIVRWAIRRGRAAIWADCGLGKSAMQLEWASHVHHKTGRDVLILTPLAVAKQMQREGAKFGIEVAVCRSGADVKPGLNVTNYQMLQHFNPDAFGGVVVDESDILANFTGQTKRQILSSFRDTPYKLDCSATPAPNDHLELGNHADFLGVMESNEMISRWFLNDAGEAGNYRLKRHAERDFWRWVSTWAACVGKPSDLGYPDEGFDLPPLEIAQHVVDVDLQAGKDEGLLFRIPEMSATSIHREMRMTAGDRAAKVAELIAADDPAEPWIIWCNTDYEADALKRLIPEAVEIRGSESVVAKESKVDRFSQGETRLLISKPGICGHGLNWQHCRRMAYVGLSYSYKQFYQSIRRSWRFGQTRPVTAHVVLAETEGRVLETIRRKQADHETMKRAMVAAVSEFGLAAEQKGKRFGDGESSVPMIVPTWMESVA